MTSYGNTDWVICISTAYTTGPVPSGDYIRFTTEKVRVNGKRLTATKYLASRNSVNTKAGKKKHVVNFDGRLLKMDGTSIYNDLDTVANLLDSWLAAAIGPFYMWIIFKEGANYYYFPFRDSTNTKQRYLKGYVDDYTFEIDQSKKIICRIEFGEGSI
jgi:hypothetical protein